MEDTFPTQIQPHSRIGILLQAGARGRTEAKLHATLG